MKKLIFKQLQSPGDLIVLTSALRNLNLCYPKEYYSCVWSYYPEVFSNLYNVCSYFPKKQELLNSEKIINLDYGAYLHKCRKEGKHFSDCFVDILNDKLNLSIENKCSLPELYLNKIEIDGIISKLKELNCFDNPYWLLNAGIKNDIPLKGWPVIYYQELVNSLNSSIFKHINIIQVGSSNDVHPQLNGVINLVGKTTLRELFALTFFASGVITGVSMLHHIAAAFNVKTVTIAGGREEPSWEDYCLYTQKYLHTIGDSDCCIDGGCWKKTQDECNFVKKGFAQCMWNVLPEHVFSAINFLI